MNYIGSKHRLLSAIASLIEENHLPHKGLALDLFSGTGVVAQLLKSLGYDTVANDWQYYAYITTSAHLKLHRFPRFKRLFLDDTWATRLKSVDRLSFPTYSTHIRDTLSGAKPATMVLSYLAQLAPYEGIFTKTYCEGGNNGRLYFSYDNGCMIQAIRDQIEAWKQAQLLGDDDYTWLLASLIESADRVANTASVYGAFLKKIKPSAAKKMTLFAIHPIPRAQTHQQVQTYCEDASTLVQTLQDAPFVLTYIDPPYNHRQYASNYHLLETIARWDFEAFSPRGKAGLRSADEHRSSFCRKREAAQAFLKLFQRVPSDYVLFSYNNEGLLDEETLLNLFEQCFVNISFYKVPHTRFRSDTNGPNRHYKRGDETEEFLILAKKKHSSRLLRNKAGRTIFWIQPNHKKKGQAKWQTRV